MAVSAGVTILTDPLRAVGPRTRAGPPLRLLRQPSRPLGGERRTIPGAGVGLTGTSIRGRSPPATSSSADGDPLWGASAIDQLAAARWGQDAVQPIVKGFFHAPPPPEHAAEYLRIALAASPHAAVEAARSNARNNVLSRLGDITVPTLIIQGRHDTVRTVAHGEEMQARVSDARLEVLEGSGHTPQLEEPDAFHRLALPFLLAGR